MSKLVKRFRKYSEDLEESHRSAYDHREHLKEKKLQAALRSKTKSNLLTLIDEDY